MAKSRPTSPSPVRRPNTRYYEHGISPKPANVKKPPAARQRRQRSGSEEGVGIKGSATDKKGVKRLP